VRRREFITLVGGTAATWPLAAQAQQTERIRQVGVLMSTGSDDPETQLRVDALVQGLRQAAWIAGQNLKIDIRFASGDTARLRSQALDMLALTPDVIVIGGRAATVVPLFQQAGSKIPIVFVQGLDPVGSVMSQALRDRVATPPASPNSSMV
jgi:putative ABC transport system substrate-binding protein